MPFAGGTQYRFDPHSPPGQHACVRAPHAAHIPLLQYAPVSHAPAQHGVPGVPHVTHIEPVQVAPVPHVLPSQQGCARCPPHATQFPARARKAAGCTSTHSTVDSLPPHAWHIPLPHTPPAAQLLVRTARLPEPATQDAAKPAVALNPSVACVARAAPARSCRRTRAGTARRRTPRSPWTKEHSMPTVGQHTCPDPPHPTRMCSLDARGP